MKNDIVIRILFCILLTIIDIHSSNAQNEAVNAAFKAKQKPLILRVVSQTLVVNGKKSTVFNIIQPDGTEGFTGTKGDYFDVKLKNATTVPIGIHWHGLILPNNQDGVAYVTQLPIPPGGTYDYHFKILQAGTYWMHSHFKFHEQQLMTAPLILKDPHERYPNDQNIVVMFQDFSFTEPAKIFADLQHAGMKMEGNSMPMLSDSMPKMKMQRDLNDVKYDAFLANRHTLRNPQIFKVNAGNVVRLRLINGSSATNFWVYTGKLVGTAIAADGNFIEPIKNTAFQIAVAQRLDIEVTIPKDGGAFPIFAQVEGTNKQTGFVLATTNTKIPQLNENAAAIAPPLNDTQEMQLHAIESLVKRPITATLNYKLTGNMQNYIWEINNEVWPRIKPFKIKKNDRVEMIFTNDTDMAHPMHFHGHVFQVSAINGKSLKNGPMRDTILVLPHTTKSIIFDADNPGIWMLHCHVLYHMLAGMMTTTNYIGYPAPKFYLDLINGKLGANLTLHTSR